ncbi:DUF4010 domain-containing protein [Roseiarcaceae bacterium H3SJ34-1]|uniref:MgtC/SapB family protein n=1 Tax=Terripilifer ovatus TaxID=3032367 RepID=UPI003AB9302E|nr:DUF4010 domain-containing protein [Roseiarcaceae bacterium H3SJ34-1]
METSSLLFRLGLALAVGLLVGTERHWRERTDAPGSRTAGIRTFGTSGLLGGLTAALSQQLPASGAGASLLIALVFLSFTAVFGFFQWREAEEHHEFSVTSVVVGQATFILGALAVLGDPAITAAAAIGLTLLLASRETLHGFIAKLEWAELRSAILLLAMAFVVLPLLPNRAVGPFQAINPAEIWIFAIALAAVSYVGYVAVRFFGTAYGPLIAGIAGGLVSSTAVALTSARRSRAKTADGAANAGVIAAGALAASTISVLRAIVVVMVLLPDRVATIAPVLGIGAAMLAAAAIVSSLRSTHEPVAPTELGNPFRLWSVLQLTAILALATFVVRVAATTLGDNATIITSAIMGFADIDPVILSVAQLGSAIPPLHLELSILLAVATNIVAKAAYSFAIGSRRYAFMIGGASALALSASAAAALFIIR